MTKEAPIYSLITNDRQAAAMAIYGESSFLMLFDSPMECELYAATNGYRDTIPHLQDNDSLMEGFKGGQLQGDGVFGVCFLSCTGRKHLFLYRDTLDNETPFVHLNPVVESFACV